MSSDETGTDESTPHHEESAAGDLTPLEKGAIPVIESPVSHAEAIPVIESTQLQEEEVSSVEGAEAEEESKAPEDYSRDSGNYSSRKAGPFGFSRGQWWAVIIVAVLAVLLSIAGGLAFAWYQNMQDNMSLDDPSINESLTQVGTSEPYWTLILGSDSRKNTSAGSRSDVMMLARIDPETKKISLISFPRDTKVELEGYGTQKINAAYALGGAKLAISTVEDYADIKISHYVEVYFSGFTQLVDGLGGVYVDVPEYCSYNGVTIKPGEQLLNGKQALTFARCRKTYSGGDFTRTKCQRILVQALASKVLALDAPSIPSTLSNLSSCFSTDMDLNTLAGLALQLQGTSSKNIYSAMCPSTSGMLGSASYTFTYIDQWKLMMRKANAGKDPSLDKTEVSICGNASTKTESLDMTSGLSSGTDKKLQDYYDKRAAKKAATS